MQIDPLAEKYYAFTPYGYCAGNPVCLLDPIPPKEKKHRIRLENFKINPTNRVMKKRLIFCIAISVSILWSCTQFDDSPISVKYFHFDTSKIAASDYDGFGRRTIPSAFLENKGVMYTITEQSIIRSDDFPKASNTIFSTDSLLFSWVQGDKSYTACDNYLYGCVRLDDRRTPGHLSPDRVFSFNVETNEMRFSKKTFAGIHSLWLGREGHLFVSDQGRVLWELDNNLEAKCIREYSGWAEGGLSDGYWIAGKEQLEIVRNDTSSFFDIPNIEVVFECNDQHLCVVCQDTNSQGIIARHIINNNLEETITSISTLKDVLFSKADSSGDNLVLVQWIPMGRIICSSDGGYTWTMCKKRISGTLTKIAFRGDDLLLWEY